MRSITRKIVLLFVSFVLYFGYSSWLTIQTQNSNIEGSLLIVILDPLRLVLFGGVIALFIPLIKSLFFGTIIGIKNYINVRKNNILFNFEKTINFTIALKKNLIKQDLNILKNSYAEYQTLSFKPAFLSTMMEEIAEELIKENNTTNFISPCQTIINSLNEMYNKERITIKLGKGSEIFFDFKRGYEYISIGSKYNIAYYNSFDNNLLSKTKLGWKLFSLEMFKFYFYLIIAIIPTTIISVIVLPILSNNLNDGFSNYIQFIVFLTFAFFSILFHCIFVFSKKSYHKIKVSKQMILPAIIYYFLITLMMFSFSIGWNHMLDINFLEPNAANDYIWSFFFKLGYLILSSCLILYIISTLMDYNKNIKNKFSLKVAIDGIILPLISWIAATIFININYIGVIEGSQISLIILGAFWLYLSISGLLINNLSFISKKDKLILLQNLQDENKKLEEKQAKQ